MNLHPVVVACAFRPWRHEFWLGLMHDAVEDDHAPRALLRMWPALDAITRREAEPYFHYIARVAKHPVARRVKIADLRHNLRRNGGPPRETLRIRYERALSVFGEQP